MSDDDDYTYDDNDDNIDDDGDYVYNDDDQDEDMVVDDINDHTRKLTCDITSIIKAYGDATAFRWHNELKLLANQFVCTQMDEACNEFYVHLDTHSLVLVMKLPELFPKEPPVITIVSPDMDPESRLAVHHMNILKTQNWNECLSLLDVMKTIENIIKKIGKPRDNWNRLEQASFELGTLLDVQSQILIHTVASEGESTLPMFGVTAEKQEAAPGESGKLWKKGTGYGHGQQSQMNIDQVIQDSQKKIKSIQDQVSMFYDMLIAQPPEGEGEYHTRERRIKHLKDLEGLAPTSATFQALQLRATSGATKKSAEYTLARSTFTPAMSAYLKGASLFDYDDNKDLFQMIEQIAKALQQNDLLTLLERWNLNSCSSSTTTTKNPTPKKAKTVCGGDGNDDYADLFEDLHVEQVEFAAPIYAKSYARHTAKKGKNTKTDEPATSLSSKGLTRRALLEMKILQESLTISEHSSVFVRQNEADVTQYKILIVPADDTPYAYGCYVFNVVLPSEYPSVPPSVQLQTTDGGRVRFNPNLYNCGKVCLSLLGTWHGGGEAEGWNAKLSNLLAVVLSIQALIFIGEPYYNEPGYERARGTKKGDEASESYTKNIQMENVKVAIIKQSLNPTPEFAEVIQKHFRYHREAIKSHIKDHWKLDSLAKEFDKGMGNLK